MKIYEYEMLETEMTEENRNYGGGVKMIEGDRNAER